MRNVKLRVLSNLIFKKLIIPLRIEIYSEDNAET
jgi:hypothetical protein